MRGKVPGAFQTDTLKSKCDQNTNFLLFYYCLPEKNSRWGKLIKNYTGSNCKRGKLKTESSPAIKRKLLVPR
jgi:hypothetical protein